MRPNVGRLSCASITLPTEAHRNSQTRRAFRVSRPELQSILGCAHRSLSPLQLPLLIIPACVARIWSPLTHSLSVGEKISGVIFQIYVRIVYSLLLCYVDLPIIVFMGNHSCFTSGYSCCDLLRYLYFVCAYICEICFFFVLTLDKIICDIFNT